MGRAKERVHNWLRLLKRPSDHFEGSHTQLDEPHESQQLSGRQGDAEIDGPGPGGRGKEGNDKTVTFSDGD